MFSSFFPLGVPSPHAFSFPARMGNRANCSMSKIRAGQTGFRNLVTAVLMALLALAQAYGEGSGSEESARNQAMIFNLPMQFEPNNGQTSGQIKFLSRGPGYSLFFAPDQVLLSLRTGHSAKEVKSAPGKHAS